MISSNKINSDHKFKLKGITKTLKFIIKKNKTIKIQILNLKKTYQANQKNKAKTLRVRKITNNRRHNKRYSKQKANNLIQNQLNLIKKNLFLQV